MRRRRRRLIAKFALVVTKPVQNPLLQRSLESLVVQSKLAAEPFELGDSHLLDVRAALLECDGSGWVVIGRLFRSLDHLKRIRRIN